MKSAVELRKIIERKLKEKTSWGRNEVMQLVDEAIIEWLEKEAEKNECE